MVGDVVHRPRWGVTTEDAVIRTQNAVQEEDVAGMGEYLKLHIRSRVAHGCMGNRSHCVTINGKLGCCPNGQTCISEPQCSGEATCSGSNAQTSTTFASVPTSITVSSTSPSSFTPPFPSITTRIATSQILATTGASHSGAETTASHLSTRPGANPPETRDQTSRTARATGSEAAFAQSQSTTNIGAIAGGSVAGVLALVAILISLIIWRRKQSTGGPDAETPAAGTGDIPSHDPAYNPGIIPPTPGTVDPFLTPMSQHPNPGVSYFTSHDPAYNPGIIPPTPGTVDPFLTPMSQHPNPGVSYFTGAVDRPLSGTSSTPHYTGLPEPQHGDDMGIAIGTTAMPVPRHDMHHPHPLPMSVTPMGEPAPDSPPVRVWSGFGSRPPSGQIATYAGGNAPYQSPSGWSNHETTNTNSVYSNLPSAANAYSPTPPPRAPSTVYQPSSEGGGYNGNRETYSPPASPPPEILYPGAIGGNLGGLPSGAAPPVTNFTQGENSLH
ncbi:unnamed protein product [Rhizoctonia solani]|uniref:Uncharacterized protein n=1 Tax=Rhizoctonia solani TaxID=456999 RepID=A0A8H3GIY9_9AGAM|nr:unnamed protein product [Rhizoctonia solani]